MKLHEVKKDERFQNEWESVIQRHVHNVVFDGDPKVRARLASRCDFLMDKETSVRRSLAQLKRQQRNK